MCSILEGFPLFHLGNVILNKKELPPNIIVIRFSCNKIIMYSLNNALFRLISVKKEFLLWEIQCMDFYFKYANPIQNFLMQTLQFRISFLNYFRLSTFKILYLNHIVHLFINEFVLRNNDRISLGRLFHLIYINLRKHVLHSSITPSIL